MAPKKKEAPPVITPEPSPEDEVRCMAWQAARGTSMYTVMSDQGLERASLYTQTIALHCAAVIFSFQKTSNP